MPDPARVSTAGYGIGEGRVMVAPVITTVNPTQGPATGGTSVAITGTSLSSPTGVKFGAVSATFTAVNSTLVNATAPPGTGTVQVTVITSGGTSNGVPYTYIAAPTITGLSPNQGPTAGGTSVTITGANLTLTSAVRFGATSVAYTVISDTQVVALSPPGTGSLQVTVTTPSGTSNGAPYTYITAPTITGLSPTRGPTAGGTSVTITGANLTLASAVRFGAAPATSFTVISDTQINAVSPSAAAGPVSVTVTTPGGTSGPGPYYYFVNAPGITALDAQLGPVAGGTSVVITGTDLTLASAVRFGATAATSYTVVSNTQINAVSPAGTGTVQVTVITPGGTSDPLPYTYVAAPTITGLNPTRGPAAAGTGVTITGTDLTLTSAVRFGAVPANGYTVISDTQVIAVSPTGTGTVQVSLTTPGGTSAGLSYTYVPLPQA